MHYQQSIYFQCRNSLGRFPLIFLRGVAVALLVVLCVGTSAFSQRKSVKKAFNNPRKLETARVLDDVVPKRSSGKELVIKKSPKKRRGVAKSAAEYRSRNNPPRSFQQPAKVGFGVSFQKNKAVKKEKQRRKKLARYHGGPTSMIARAKYRNAVLKSTRKRGKPKPRKQKKKKLKYDPQERKIWN
ncbi:hypothetical protein R9C00_00005 [Flammeovirgaceae bacterium SG7u.111]|nr:hypothetical protein [Flammeovirgaceae bacterium SG7u.132]WPO35836.1 hypothetical protein R9C00_00005 [Flammeovirgaceae bacterium SG7u.111]